MKSDADLLILLGQKVLSGGRRTKGEMIREFETEMISSKQNIDGKNQANGYAGLDSTGKINLAQLSVASPVNKFLRDDGSFQPITVGLLAEQTPTGKFLKDDGTWYTISTSGRNNYDGNGSTTVFQVSHGLGRTPAVVLITPRSADGAFLHYVSNITPTIFEVTYKVAPPAGTQNVSFNWDAK